MNVETTSEADRFRTLYDANHDRVHRLLGRIAGPHDAEDLTHTNGPEY
jgi:DNA-directed RNA polymerase specialized sigma24 family protein